MQVKEILEQLKSMRDPEAVEGMARYGINPENTYGIPIPTLRTMAEDIGGNHILAQKLWSSGVHEARILASMVDEPERVTGKQMEEWVRDFDSWDVCDQCCMNLFGRTPYAYGKAVEWSSRGEEYVKRAGYVLMARLAVSDKRADDREFEMFLPVIKKGASDSRNYVRKAVNWALRQIGKRSLRLNGKAIQTAEEILETNSKSAKWVASDALRELSGGAVKKRLKDKGR
jgi:3-methyladenine DNA glycosylase AlkD